MGEKIVWAIPGWVRIHWILCFEPSPKLRNRQNCCFAWFQFDFSRTQKSAKKYASVCLGYASVGFDAFLTDFWPALVRFFSVWATFGPVDTPRENRCANSTSDCVPLHRFAPLWTTQRFVLCVPTCARPEPSYIAPLARRSTRTRTRAPRPST